MTQPTAPSRTPALRRAMPPLACTLIAAAVSGAYAQATAPAPSAPAASAPAASAPAAGAPAPGAQPDAAPPPEAGAAEGSGVQSLDRVTVSATRRREAIRDVPVAVTKISADAQLELGARDLTDMLSNVPGVTFDTRGSGGTGVLVIRGVTTGSLTNPTVGIYVDDVPIGSSSGVNGLTAAYDQRLLDLANIEVLKGPQGTLYGASAMGGLLKYNTMVPDPKLKGGLLGGEVSNTNSGGTNYMGYGNVNVPLSEGTAAMRAAVFYSYDGGYVDATGPAAGENINNGSVAGGRLSFTFRPLKELDIRLSMQTQDTGFNSQGMVSYDAALNPIAGDLVRANLQYREPFDRRDNLYALNVDWDTGVGKAISITGYQTARSSNTWDYNDGYLRILPPFVTLTTNYATVSLDKFTQEFRFVSPSGKEIEWVAGVFYANEKSDSTTTLTANTTPGAPWPDGTKLYDNAGIESKWQETALYGTVVWNPTKQLALTAGARVSWNSLDFNQRDFGLITQNKVITSSSSETPATYLLAARYRIDPMSSVYARAASGYRAGGPNTPFIDPVTGTSTPIAPYQSDSLWSYEVGYKADLPNYIGAVDMALFQIDWKDMQTKITQGAVTYTGNAGTARIRGFEFGGTLFPLPGLSLRAALTLMNPKLTEDSPGLGGVAGDRLPATPKVAAALSGRYEFNAGDLPAYVLGNISYTGDRTTGFAGNPGSPSLALPAFTLIDLGAGATVAGFDVGLYVRNLLDERGLTGGFTQFVPVGGSAWVTTVRPRTFGLTVSKAF